MKVSLIALFTLVACVAAKAQPKAEAKSYYNTGLLGLGGLSTGLYTNPLLLNTLQSAYGYDAYSPSYNYGYNNLLGLGSFGRIGARRGLGLGLSLGGLGGLYGGGLYNSYGGLGLYDDYNLYNYI